MIKRLMIVLLLISPLALGCDLNAAGPVSSSMLSPLANEPAREILIHNNVQLALPAAPGVLRLSQSSNASLIDEMSSWPTPSGQIASIKAQPAVLDHNYDGIADALYAVDSSGLVWYLPLNLSGFQPAQLLADFSHLAAEFRQPVQLVQSVAPSFGTAMQRQTMLLLIASTASDGDILLMVKHSQTSAGLITLDSLVDRSAISQAELQTGIAEPLWQQIQYSAGWYVRLQRRVSALPAVYAGVVYLTSAENNQLNADCSLTNSAQPQLHALHLHHAAAVYAQRQWQIVQPDAAVLQLQQNSQGELELLLHNAQQQQLVLTDILAVDDSCASCSALIPPNTFPRSMRLATFQLEQGGH